MDTNDENSHTNSFLRTTFNQFELSLIIYSKLIVAYLLFSACQLYFRRTFFCRLTSSMRSMVLSLHSYSVAKQVKYSVDCGHFLNIYFLYMCIVYNRAYMAFYSNTLIKLRQSKNFETFCHNFVSHIMGLSWHDDWWSGF